MKCRAVYYADDRQTVLVTSLDGSTGDSTIRWSPRQAVAVYSGRANVSVH
jgi:hypothetical protein